MSKVKIEPIGAKVVVKPIKEEEKSVSGIILPESVDKEKPNMGEVVAVGKLSDSANIKVGDKLLFSEYGYDTVELDGEEYYILQESKILAIVK
jgi:chaperonin GroES